MLQQKWYREWSERTSNRVGAIGLDLNPTSHHSRNALPFFPRVRSGHRRWYSLSALMYSVLAMMKSGDILAARLYLQKTEPLAVRAKRNNIVDVNILERDAGIEYLEPEP